MCRWSGEIRGQIAFPGLSGTAVLSATQQLPAEVSSSASGFGSVVITSETTFNASVWVSNLVGQTDAHIHAGGRWRACVRALARVAAASGSGRPTAAAAR